MNLTIIRPTTKSSRAEVEGDRITSSSPKSSLECSPFGKKNGKPIRRSTFCDLEVSDEQHPSSKSPQGVRFFYLIDPQHRN